MDTKPTPNPHQAYIKPTTQQTAGAHTPTTQQTVCAHHGAHQTQTKPIKRGQHARQTKPYVTPPPPPPLLSADHPGSAGPQVLCMEEHSHGIHEELTKIHDNSRTMALGDAGHSPSSPRGRMRVVSTGEPLDSFRPIVEAPPPQHAPTCDSDGRNELYRRWPPND